MGVVNATCPKCSHSFSGDLGVSVNCGGSSNGCRERRVMSGGGLVKQRPPATPLMLPPPEPCLQLTPSSPLTLTIWPTTPPLHSNQDDLLTLDKVVTNLRLSGWYYDDFTWQASQQALKDCSPGTFIVRDSGDHNFLYSLSVQTAKGPTSVRLHYAGGLFRLDAEPGLAPLMPQFDCVVKLVEHYSELTKARGAGHVWVDATGGRHSPVEVRRPLLKGPPSLMHAARLAVNRAIKAAATPSLPLLPPITRLGLPIPLQEYLAQYPYTC